MRYFKHLALWAICGLFVVALVGAIAGAVMGSTVAWIQWPFTAARMPLFSETTQRACHGAIMGAQSGAACGFIAFLTFSVFRPPSRESRYARICLACNIVCGFVLVCSPILGGGLAVIAAVLMKFSPQIGYLRAISNLLNWEFHNHVLLVALPVIIGSIGASRALRRVEEEAARALPYLEA